MGDSRRQGPRSPYARPAEIDTALVERESLRAGTTAKPNLNRSTPAAPLSIPGLKPTAPRPNAESERKGLRPNHIGKSTPSPLGPSPTISPQKGLTPPPGIASTESSPKPPVGIHTLIFERKQVPPPPPISRLKPIREDLEPLKLSNAPSEAVRRGV